MATNAQPLAVIAKLLDLTERRVQQLSREGVITLLEAPVRLIAAGDAFTLRAGCDKRFETCRMKFANAVNFRGFPHIPGPDTVIRYASQGDGHDGQPL